MEICLYGVFVDYIENSLVAMLGSVKSHHIVAIGKLV